MAIDCGSQVCICDLPIHLDTYAGCSHGCAYCFVKRKHGIEDVRPLNCVKNLENFIGGKRALVCSWCDWNIPLHWGAMSDPFQPAERGHGISRRCLEVFARTQYPFVVSTKGRLVAEEPYASLMARCNCVLQISAVSPLYDLLEPGAPPFAERIEMCRKMAPKVKRIIFRLQPYIREALPSILNNSLERMRDAGAYGIVVEGMKYITPRPHTVKVAGDYAYEKNILRYDFTRIRERAHALGLRFFCGENRLRSMGDDPCCCGIEGLDGFTPNRFNAYHLLRGDAPPPTAGQLAGRSNCFKAMHQDALSARYLHAHGWVETMKTETARIARAHTLG